jgi:hypothetical protein
VVVLGGMLFLIFMSGLGGGFLVTAVPVCVMVMLIYYGSVFFAVRRFNRRADYLIGKYAAHAARSGH